MNPPQRLWVVVGVLAINSFVVGGLGAVAIGLLINPWMTEFGWSNGLTSGIATAFNFTLYLAAPIAGITVDRLGARPVMCCGVLVTALGFFLSGHCHSWHAMLGAFVLTGLGFCAAFYVPSAIVISKWMGPRKNFGMGILLGAMSGGAALFSVLIGASIEAHGWQSTVEVIALLAASMLLPIALVRTQHRDGRQQAEGAYRGLPSHGSQRASADGRGKRDKRSLWNSPPFLYAVASSVFFSLGMGSIYFHVASVLVSAGYSTYWAGMVFGCTWVCSGLGSLLLGILADHFGTKAILAVALLSCAVGPLFLLGARVAPFGVGCVAAFVILWGVPANGIAQFIPAVFAERLGSSHLGALLGVQQAVAGVAGAAAPMITGLLYDRFRDYRWAIFVGSVEILVAVVLVLLIGVRHAADGVLRSDTIGAAR